jgi:Fe-S-cluster containining protein
MLPERTKCDCKECTKFCKIMPGYLIPSDLYKIYQHSLVLASSIHDFVGNYLRASPGAIVIKNGELTRIRTIVPAIDKETGYCIFLNSEMKCIIHEVSPYACRMADEHMSGEEANRRSQIGLNEIDGEKNYLFIWSILNNLGLKARPPEELRKELENEETENKIF